MSNYEASWEFSRKITILNEVYTYGFDAVVSQHLRFTNSELDFIYTLKGLCETELQAKYTELYFERMQVQRRESDDIMLIQYYKHKSLYDSLLEVDGETLCNLMSAVLKHESREEGDWKDGLPSCLDVEYIKEKWLDIVKNKMKIYSEYQNTLPNE